MKMNYNIEIMDKILYNGFLRNEVLDHAYEIGVSGMHVSNRIGYIGLSHSTALRIAITTEILHCKRDAFLINVTVEEQTCKMR